MTFDGLYNYFNIPKKSKFARTISRRSILKIMSEEIEFYLDSLLMADA